MSTLAWPILLLALAVILLLAEVFVPSGGLIGLLALGCAGLSLWHAFRQSTTLGISFLAVDCVLLPLVFMLAMYIWPKTPLARRIFLRPPGPEEIEVAHAPQRLDLLLGQYGRALTPLRPSGLVEFEGRRLDALSEDGLIPSGSLVQAVRVRAGQIIVRTAADLTFRDTDTPVRI